MAEVMTLRGGNALTVEVCAAIRAAFQVSWSSIRNFFERPCY
jgi:hypothetical protein